MATRNVRTEARLMPIRWFSLSPSWAVKQASCMRRASLAPGVLRHLDDQVGFRGVGRLFRWNELIEIVVITFLALPRKRLETGQSGRESVNKFASGRLRPASPA